MSFQVNASLDAVQAAPNVVDWEECACLLCGGASFTPLVEAPDRAAGPRGLWFMVAQCDRCGLCFTNPRPSPKAMGAFYAAAYKPHHLPRERVQQARWYQRLRLAPMRKRFRVHGTGRLLDFGCGSGSFLLRMRRQGWTVTGLDMSEVVVDRLRTELGLHALTGTLPHPALEQASFDVITMWQALEHVHQPLETLEAARGLLAPGGKLIVTVPNIDSLAFRWFGSAWNGLDLPRHLVHFTAETLPAMLQRAGLRCGRVRMVRRSSWLRDSARIATRHFPRHSRWHAWLQGRMVSNIASWYGYLTRQADCLMALATRR